MVLLSAEKGQLLTRRGKRKGAVSRALSELRAVSDD